MQDEKRALLKADPGLAGYVAGVMDCDGSIWIARKQTKTAGASYTIRASVSNTRPKLVQWFVRHFGGRRYVTERARPSKAEYRWISTNQRAIELVEFCLPYLTIKYEQGLVALEYGSTLTGARGKRLPECYRATRERLYERMSALNKRGR